MAWHPVLLPIWFTTAPSHFVTEMSAAFPVIPEYKAWISNVCDFLFLSTVIWTLAFILHLMTPFLMLETARMSLGCTRLRLAACACRVWSHVQLSPEGFPGLWIPRIYPNVSFHFQKQDWCAAEDWGRFYEPLRLSLVNPRLLRPTVIIKSPLPWVRGRFRTFYMLGFSSISLPSYVGFETWLHGHGSRRIQVSLLRVQGYPALTFRALPGPGWGGGGLYVSMLVLEGQRETYSFKCTGFLEG